MTGLEPTQSSLGFNQALYRLELRNQKMVGQIGIEPIMTFRPTDLQSAGHTTLSNYPIKKHNIKEHKICQAEETGLEPAKDC